MRCPTLSELPPPPAEKKDWPWTEATPHMPELMSDGSRWPRISIVTPSYNYGHFLEETIRSVLLQGYPNLEYIIIDGGSTDNSVDIIKKYEEHLAYWVSEPDEGQTDAINKGYQHCTGDIFVWLNADDAYTQLTLQRVVEYYLQGYQLIAGSCLAIYSDGRKEIIHSVPVGFERYIQFWSAWFLGTGFTQPSVFIEKKIADRCFPLDKQLFMLMDYQFFLRVVSQRPKAICVYQPWVIFKFHGANKSLSNYKGSLAEFFHISLSESHKLPLVQRTLFLINLKDYMVLRPLIERQDSLSLFQVITALIHRPTLLHWPLFWKTLMKSVLGENFYSTLKQLTKRFST